MPPPEHYILRYLQKSLGQPGLFFTMSPSCPPSVGDELPCLADAHADALAHAHADACGVSWVYSVD